MAEQSLNDKIALLGTSIQALNRESSYERDKEAKKLYKKLIDLINETKEREEWARRHSRTGDEMQDIRDTFEKLEDHMRTMSDIMGESFHDLQQQQRRQNSGNNGFSSSFDANDSVIPEGMRRSGYGKTTDAISNLGGLFGSSKLQTLGSILSGQTDITSGKMMKVAEKLNFAGKLLGGQNTKIGAKLLRGRDFFERNQSFLANYLSGKLNTSENRYSNPFPSGWDSMRPRGPQAIPESFIQQEHPQQNTAQPQNNPLSSSSRINRRENDRGYEQVGKKISGVIKKFLAPEGFEEANAQRIREMKKLNKIFGKLNKNMIKMDSVLGKFMGGLKDSLKGLLKKGGGGAIQALLKYFMMGKFAKVFGGVLKGGAGLFGKTLFRAIPMLGSAITGAAPILGKALVAAGPALAVAFSGAAGMALGKIINDKLLDPLVNKIYGTKTGKAVIDKIDRGVTKVVGGIAGTSTGISKNDEEVRAHNEKVDSNFQEHIAEPLRKAGISFNSDQQHIASAGKLQWEHLTEEQQKAIGKENFEKYEKNQKARIYGTSKGDGYKEGKLSDIHANASVEDIRAGKVVSNHNAKMKEQQKQTQAPQIGENIQTTQAPGRSLGDIISSHEGSYDDVNRGAAHGYKSAKRDLTSMSVEQVMQLQDERDFNAAGKPQVIRDTLKGLVQQGIIDPKAKFDEKIQNDILVHLTEKRAGGYITGRHNQIDLSLDDLSKEWSSLENPYTGKSYYDKDGVNKAHTSAKEVAGGLEQARELYQKNIAAGMPHKEAFRAAVLGQRAESAPGEMKAKPQSEAARIAGLSEVQPNTGKIAPGSVGDLNAARVGITKDAMARNMQYVWGGNSLKTGADCSGYNSAMNLEAMRQANEQAGYEVYDMKQAQRIFGDGGKNRATAASILQNMSKETGDLRELHKDGQMKAGDTIGIRDDKRWGHAKGRWNNVGHVVQVVEDPKTGKLMIAESQRGGGKNGVTYTDAEKWKANQLKKGRQLYASNTESLANIKEGAGIDYNRTNFMAEDGMNQEALASMPPIINVPQQKGSGGGQSDAPKGGGGSGPMGAGNQDQLMTFMFGAYGYPTHIA